MNPQDQTLVAKMQQLMENFVRSVEDQRNGSPNLFYRTVDAYVKDMKSLLSSVSPTQSEPCRCRQLEKRARAIRLNDVLRMEHESELMKELRAFELVASLQMRIDVLEREVTSLSPAPEKK